MDARQPVSAAHGSATATTGSSGEPAFHTWTLTPLPPGACPARSRFAQRAGSSSLPPARGRGDAG
ncbi:hypothetical protein [Streptomyces sp. x-19]|uniref:hypothetical protein n=1 Tax=Streptomyces sp. x-19 TaxID=2789280 RepID=UPI0039811793